MIAYAQDGDRVYLDDRNLAPLTVDRAARDAARTRVRSYKNLLLVPQPEADLEVPGATLRAALFVATGDRLREAYHLESVPYDNCMRRSTRSDLPRLALTPLVAPVGCGRGGSSCGRGPAMCDAGQMDLDGKVFVVAGGAGTAGECVVLALLRHGATVAATSRSAERLDRLREAIDSPRLHPVLTEEPGDLQAAAAVRDQIIAELGPLDGVVASLGGWWVGPQLTELDLDTWRRIVDDNLTSHFITARTYLPVLADRAGAVYLALAGIAALKAVPNSGPISVTGAGQTMLLRVLAAELAGRPVRLHEIGILTPIVTRHWDGSPIQEGWLTGDEFGEYVARVAAPGFAGPDQLLLAEPAAFLPAALTTHSA